MVLMMTAAFGATALAVETGTATREEKLQAREQKIEEAQAKVAENEAKLQEKMDTRGEFGKKVAELRLSILENRKDNLALTKDINTLRSSLVQALTALKDGGTKLPEETLTQLKALRDQVKSIAEQIKATKGDIKEIAQANRTNIHAKDYEAVSAAFAQIEEIQNTRNGLLLQMKDVLTQMNGLVS
jgi:chromosome segregation ATPase